MSNTKLVASAEVFGAMLSAGITDDTAIKQDPKGYISRAAHVELSGNVEVSVVSNDDQTVNLTLPYYAILEDVKPSAISTEDLEAASGGLSMFLSYGGAQGYVLRNLHDGGSRVAENVAESPTAAPAK